MMRTRVTTWMLAGMIGSVTTTCSANALFLSDYLGATSGTSTTSSNPPFMTIIAHSTPWGGFGVDTAGAFSGGALISFSDAGLFNKGIGAHPTSSIEFHLDAFRLEGSFDSFESVVGIDPVADGLNGAIFTVLVDGEARAVATVTSVTAPSQRLLVPVFPSDEHLVLQTEYYGPAYGNHAAWADAQLGQSRILFVDDDAPVGGDGQSWSTPFAYLQDAFAAAAAGDEIRVAGGVYAPDRDEGGNVTPGDRSTTFQVMNGVAVYGGYAGLANPGDPDLRDTSTYESMLSGDLAGDDLPDFVNYGENAYRVVSANSSVVSGAILDGFTITSGNANAAPWDRGAGVYLDWGSPQIFNCLITLNASADVFMGGTGVYAQGASQAVLRDCEIKRNTGYFAVSATSGAAPLLEDCTISENTAGAVMFSGGASGTLRRCKVVDNTHADGDAAFWLIHPNSDPLIESCTVERNVGQSVSTCHHGASPTIEHCVIRANEATASPGGFLNTQYDASAPTIRNCLITKNTASGDGGAIRCGPDCAPIIASCTFAQNISGGIGGGIACAGGTPTVTDCIIWDNAPNAIHETSGAVTATFSDIEGGWTGGAGNLNLAPHFVGGPMGCYYLSQTAAGETVDSPCVDAGSDMAVNLGLDEVTTRSDEGGDSGVVDMGYHYPVAEGPVGPDCNNNLVPDDCDLLRCDGSAWCSDCNTNGTIDECDISSGISEDTNGNGAPDECDPLLVNGSFESGPAFGGCYLPVDPGSTAIDGWVVVDGQIDIVTPCWGAPPNGVRYIDLNGTCEVGAIQQIIQTTPGDTYSVLFDLADHGASHDIPRKVCILAAGQQAEFISDGQGPGQSWDEYETFTWRFTALDAETTLKFASRNFEPELACYGPLIDNVSVVRVECANPIAGDIDCDGDVDLDDFTTFAECMTGPGMFPAPAPPWSPYECLNSFDSDADEDIDLRDFARFQASFMPE